MHVGARKREWCTFGDSAQEVNALLFAFKTDAAQYEDEW